VKVSDDEMRALNITHDPFHSEWNSSSLRARTSRRECSVYFVATP
jgi:hypothetical protein